MHGELTPKVDTFAFGLVILETLTSFPVDFNVMSMVSDDPRMQLLRLPTHLSYPVTLLQLWENHIDAPSQLMPWVDSAAADLGEIIRQLFHVVARCLEKKPSNRANCVDFIHELEHARALAIALDDESTKRKDTLAKQPYRIDRHRVD